MNRIVQYTLKLFGQIGLKMLLLLPSTGTVAEWLGRGLQNLLQQFESARYLRSSQMGAFFVCRDFMILKRPTFQDAFIGHLTHFSPNFRQLAPR
jgi:hypothetical protein